MPTQAAGTALARRPQCVAAASRRPRRDATLLVGDELAKAVTAAAKLSTTPGFRPRFADSERAVWRVQRRGVLARPSPALWRARAGPLQEA